MKSLLILISHLAFSVPTNSFAQDIFEAVRKGEVERLNYLYKLKQDTINSKNQAGFSPLIIASYRGQKDCVEFLLERQAEVNANSPEGTALIAACYRNEEEIVILLLKYGADINKQTEQGTTALIFAAISHNSKLVSLLLKYGADKNLAERSGKTAMSYAQSLGAEEIMKLLGN